MPNIQLDPGIGGAKLATHDDTVAHHQKVIQEFFDSNAPDATAPILVERSTPFPVDPDAITAAKSSLATSTDLAASASTDLDSAQISVGTTGELIGLIISSSIPLKAILKTLLNGAESSDLTVFFIKSCSSDPIRIPKKFFTQAHDAGAGLDGFRITVTNMDTTQASDVYCTFLYNEV